MPINPMLVAAGAQLVGGIADKWFAGKEAKKERARQEQFAKSGIQWRVEDAKKAGIHPLAALGFQGSSPSPVTVGTDFASVGQNISRAIDAKRTAPQRLAAVDKTVQDLQLRRMGLENELLASQIAQIRQAGQPPVMPTELKDIAGNPRLAQSAIGGRFKTNPNISDAEVFEQRYGDSEIMQTLIGAGISLADLYTNAKEWLSNDPSVVYGGPRRKAFRGAR